MKKVVFILFVFSIIYSCTKSGNSSTPPVVVKLSGCDSIKQGLLKTTNDTIRLFSCLSISGCDSIRLGVLKPKKSDSIRLSSCFTLSGCDSVKLDLLKPQRIDSIRLSKCFVLNGCDSIRLGFIKQLSRFDSIRLFKCLALSVKDSLSLFPKQVKIGDTLGGGIVFYLLSSSDSGYDATRQHGFIVAFESLTSPVDGNGPVYKYKPAFTSDKIGSGLSNTKTILADPRNTTDRNTSPALLATWYRGGGFNDWYLPSKNEVDTLSKIQFYINMFPQYKLGRTWSSTEYWGLTNGYFPGQTDQPRKYDWVNRQFDVFGGYSRYYVRPIRNF